MKRPRVLLADDHRLVAEGLKSLLTAEFELVGVQMQGFHGRPGCRKEGRWRLQPDAFEH